MERYRVPQDEEFIRTVRARELREHRLTELIGILQGLRWSVSDDGGVLAVARWLEEHPELHETWPANEIRDEIAATGCWNDGWIEDCAAGDPRRLATAAECLRREAGPRLTQLQRAHEAMYERPRADFDDPVPTISFENRRFVFTGVFTLCDRSLGERATAALGGLVRTAVTRITDYLVVGTRTHAGWRHGQFGQKIARVQAWRNDAKTACAIVREEDWARAMLATRTANTLGPDAPSNGNHATTREGTP